MNMAETKSSGKGKRRKRSGYIYIICWVVIPLLILTMIILDGLSIYIFNTQRLIVLGFFVLVMLIPFFTEITVQNISFKRDLK